MSRKKCLHAVFLDIDDTLYSTSEFSRLARRNGVRAMIKHGLHVSAGRCLRELDEVISEFSSNYPYHFNKLLARLGSQSYQGVNPEILIAAAVAAYHDTKVSQLKPFPDVLPFLRRLKKAAMMTGIISTGLSTKQAEKIIRLGIVRYVDADKVFISDQIGISKPNPKLFQHALKAAGVAASASMYVGDSSPNDIDPCNSLGMVTAKVLRGGRHEEEPGRTEPAHVVRNLLELWEIMQRRYILRPCDGDGAGRKGVKLH